MDSDKKMLTHRISVRPKTVLILMLLVISFLLLANIGGIVLKFYFSHDYCYGMVPCFDFDTEANIPTLYSSLALAFVSMLLAYIAFCHRISGKSYLLWGGLSFIFLFLSADEFVSVHERLEEPVRRFLISSGLQSSELLFYVWTIPYVIALIAIFFIYLRFLFKLPRYTMEPISKLLAPFC